MNGWVLATAAAAPLPLLAARDAGLDLDFADAGDEDPAVAAAVDAAKLFPTPAAPSSGGRE
eukprot:262193-Pelagomonas_calceolata.AAC.4